MSENSLSVSFSVDGKAPYWVRMDQEEYKPYQANAEDVAELLDSLFDSDPCNEDKESEQGESIDDTTNEPKEPPVGPEGLDALAAEIFGFPWCSGDLDGSYVADVNVYVSHVELPYTLHVNNGEVVETVVKEEMVTGRVKVNGKSVNLEYPVNGHVICSVPVKKVEGSTLFFSEELNDVMIKVTYPAKWFVAKVRVFGDRVTLQPKECLAICFYQKLVAELEIEPPEEVDEPTPDEKIRLCLGQGGSGSSGVVSEEDKVTCYRTVISIQKCQCDTSKDHGQDEIEQDVPCPQDYYCTYLDHGECRKNLGTEVVYTYVDCGLDENVSTKEFYKKACCKEKPDDITLPRCDTLVESNHGGRGLSEEKKAYYRSIYGDDTKFIPMRMTNTSGCGEITTHQRNYPKDCCGSVPAMSLTGPEEVDVGSVYTYYVTGGAAPYTWDGSKGIVLIGTGVTEDGGSATFRITDCICEDGVISVTDNCGTQVSLSIHTDNAYWSEIPADQCYLSAPGDEWDYDGGYFYTLENEDYKMVLNLSYQGCSIYCEASGTPYPNCGGTAPDGVEDPAVACITDFATWYINNTQGDDFVANWAVITDPSGGPGDYGTVTFDGNNCQSCADSSPICCGSCKYAASLKAYEWRCDYEDPEWDTENSVEVLADNSNGLVFVTGGKGPYTWEIEIGAVGFSFFDDAVIVRTSDPQVRVYTSDACGACTIICTDDCGETTSGSVRAADGRWVTIDDRSIGGRYPEFNELVADGTLYDCTANGYRTSRVVNDEVQGGLALVYQPNDYSTPDPDLNKSITYHTWHGFPGGTCSHRYIPDLYGAIGPFFVLYGFNCHCFDGDPCYGYWISEPVVLKEWRC